MTITIWLPTIRSGAGAKNDKTFDMQTGENEQALRKIIDYTRLLSLAILLIHFYLSCYPLFASLKLQSKITDQLLFHIAGVPIFHSEWSAKGAALVLLLVSLAGTKGKKDEQLKPQKAWLYSIIGLLIYILSYWLLNLNYTSYITVSLTGYLLLMTGLSLFSRILGIKLARDIFNTENETFPQEERLLENEDSINLPARYHYRGREHASWINITNPFRGTGIYGGPGAGKTYFLIRNIIQQQIAKGYSMLVYDFKYDDLSCIAYNALLKYGGRSFWVINFEQLMHRCNPLEPQTMFDITDAMEASRTIMLGLNREWIKKTGDFFVESPINFVTALIWFLKKYKEGRYCTLPHVIELSLLDYKELFSVLSQEPEIEVLMNPFISAWRNEAYEQLEGQIASAKISLARLSSPNLYYVLSGNDFSLSINDPNDPKIVCLANNPQKSQTYGAVLSLYVNRITKLANRKGQCKSSLIFDEFPTLYFNGIDGLIATARSNKVAVTVAMQDYSQLKKDYGQQQAEVILNICGNIICGQVNGDTAKHLSERFGKINQIKESLSVNATDTSFSRSTQLDYAIPASKISGLSSGEFVGMVADDPTTRIELKTFHSRVLNDHDAIKTEESNYQAIPMIRNTGPAEIIATYLRIKADIAELPKSPI